ncbi:hypothetical protein [Glutamicibacter arilaitensis]|uniref:hypothetical protein n=1 Tax=Glutamicibacter arilaitensis TaxID=256701 RepID=UPI003FD255FF
MSGYVYSDRQLREWPDASQAAIYYEQAQNAIYNADYWKHRALSAERRMTEHECEEQ